jgi:hypothetical protein
MRSLAVRGAGLIYSSTFHTSRELANGSLDAALLDLSPGNDGLFLYWASKSTQTSCIYRLCSEMTT